jgi:hypothetical protein
VPQGGGRGCDVSTVAKRCSETTDMSAVLIYCGASLLQGQCRQCRIVITCELKSGKCYLALVRHLGSYACKVNVKLSLYRPRRPSDMLKVEAPTFSDIWLIDGGEVISPTRRPLFTPRKIPGTHFS